MKKDRLNTKLKEDGVFWEPAQLSETFAGKVEFDGKHIDFSTSPTFESFDRDQMRVLFSRMG